MYPTVYALGSYGRTLGVYMEPDGSCLCLLDGQVGGITHVKFTPDGNKVLAGGRKDSEILVWDMRNPGSLYCSLKRVATTNQRVYFDVDPRRPDLVASANTDGTVRMWDLSKIPSDGGAACEAHFRTTVTEGRECLNGVSFSPMADAFATSSGQRHYDAAGIMSDSEGEDIEDKDAHECKLKLWRLQFGAGGDEAENSSMAEDSAGENIS